MIDLAPEMMEEVRRLLREHIPRCEVRAFGSRVAGGAREFSDLDLLLAAASPIEPHRIEALRDAFSESDLPILVDIVDLSTITPEFAEAIGTKYEIIQQPG
jgi:type I restriction enzyme S subunit